MSIFLTSGGVVGMEAAFKEFIKEIVEENGWDKEKITEVARKLLKRGISVESVAEDTELDISIVAQLKKELDGAVL